MKDFIENRFHTKLYEEFRRRVIDECNVSSATWSNWKNGVYAPEAKYRPVINRIAIELFGTAVFDIQSDRDTDNT